MRILIVDDHPIVASGCRAVLADEPEMILLEASDAESGERALPSSAQTSAWSTSTCRPCRGSNWRAVFSP